MTVANTYLQQIVIGTTDAIINRTTEATAAMVAATTECGHGYREMLWRGRYLLVWINCIYWGEYIAHARPCV